MVTVCWPRWPPCPYMVKTHWKSSPEPRNRELWTLKLCIKHRWLAPFQICLSDDPKLTFALPAEMLNWLSYAYIWEKYWKVSFSKTVEGWCIIFGTDTCTLLTKKMKIYQGHIMVFMFHSRHGLTNNKNSVTVRDFSVLVISGHVIIRPNWRLIYVFSCVSPVVFFLFCFCWLVSVFTWELVEKTFFSTHLLFQFLLYSLIASPILHFSTCSSLYKVHQFFSGV